MAPLLAFGHGAEFLEARVRLDKPGWVKVELTADYEDNPLIADEEAARLIMSDAFFVRDGGHETTWTELAPLVFEHRTKPDLTAPVPEDPTWADRPHGLLTAVWEYAPKSLTVHRRVFGAAVEFGHEFNGIVCDAADLEAPNPGADPVMARYSNKLLQPALKRDASMRTRVRQLVVLLLPHGLCCVEVVAQHLGVDRRTVHRQLDAEGTSFSALLQDERRELARRYVEGTARPMIEVAALLGFSSASAFSRWYRCSFGASAVARRRVAASAH